MSRINLIWNLGAIRGSHVPVSGSGSSCVPAVLINTKQFVPYFSADKVDFPLQPAMRKHCNKPLTNNEGTLRSKWNRYSLNSAAFEPGLFASRVSDDQVNRIISKYYCADALPDRASWLLRWIQIHISCKSLRRLPAVEPEFLIL